MIVTNFRCLEPPDERARRISREVDLFISRPLFPECVEMFRQPVTKLKSMPHFRGRHSDLSLPLFTRQERALAAASDLYAVEMRKRMTTVLDCQMQVARHELDKFNDRYSPVRQFRQTKRIRDEGVLEQVARPGWSARRQPSDGDVV
jgi:hypothetical protein